MNRITLRTFLKKYPYNSSIRSAQTVSCVCTAQVVNTHVLFLSSGPSTRHLNRRS